MATKNLWPRKAAPIQPPLPVVPTRLPTSDTAKVPDDLATMDMEPSPVRENPQPEAKPHGQSEGVAKAAPPAPMILPHPALSSVVPEAAPALDEGTVDLEPPRAEPPADSLPNLPPLHVLRTNSPANPSASQPVRPQVKPAISTPPARPVGNDDSGSTIDLAPEPARSGDPMMTCDFAPPAAAVSAKTSAPHAGLAKMASSSDSATMDLEAPRSPADPMMTCDFATAPIVAKENGPRHLSANSLGQQPSIQKTMDSVLGASGIPIMAAGREDIVPGYRVLGELGRGGMGVVYKARHMRLQRIVALKMVLSASHASPLSLARFRTEAEAVAHLQHPHIVQIYENGEHNGLPFFSLEFVEGGCLADRLRDKAPPAKAAAELVEMLASAMDFAHQRGVIHRDLKPANVLMTAPSSGGSTITRHSALDMRSTSKHWSGSIPKIADFGLAKRLGDDSSKTEDGAILGTPSYMAPEQAKGDKATVGAPADIYSLGAILYEMLTGRPPFRAGTPLETIHQLIHKEVVPPRQLDPTVPVDIETICLKCLEKDPGKRYATAGQLALDLRHFLLDEPILARPTPIWERVWKWCKRRPALVALVAVINLAALAMVLLIIWHNASLKGQLEQARADEREARQREQDALAAERRAALEAETKQLLHSAKVADENRDWPNARLHLTKALATIANEERLESLRAEAETLLAGVEEHLREQNDLAAAQKQLQQFIQLRDETLFVANQMGNMDANASLRAIRAGVDKALGVFGLNSSPTGQVTLSARLADAEKAEVLADGYQLLLVLAEAVAKAAPAQPGPARHAQLSEAMKLLRAALAFGKPSRAWHQRAARYSRQLGDDAGADAADQAATTATVSHVLDFFLLGDEAYRRGEMETASKWFDRVLQQSPTHFWAQYLGALCLLQQQRPGEAKARLNACVLQRPNYVWLYILRGFAEGELRAFEAAEADFAKALTLPLDEMASYVLHVNRGVMRVRQQKLDDAVSDLTKAMELKPGEYQAPANLAFAYQQRKQWDLALEQWNRAIALESSLAQLYRARGRVWLETGDSARAVADLQEAVRREPANSPTFADTQGELGRLLLRAERPAEALEALDAAVAARPHYPLAHRLRAEALFHLRRFAEVVQAFDRYIEIGKPLESVYRGRGLALAELGRYPGAIEDYTKAIEIKPTARVFALRGWAHLVCEAPRLAKRDFDLALDLEPDFAEGYAGRGFLSARQGRWREAIADANDALRLGSRAPRELLNAARILAQCDAAAQTRALTLLEEALKKIPASQRAGFVAQSIRPDPALRALRTLPGFQRLATPDESKTP